MLLAHPTIDMAKLRRAVSAAFGDLAGDSGGPGFVPLGEDSWCYRWGRLWISVRRDRQGHFPGAYQAAHELRVAGKEFVLAPLPGRDGEVVRLVDGLPVVVYPYLDGVSVAAGPVPGPRERDHIVGMVRNVHASTVRADIPVEDYQFPFEDELSTVLGAASARDPQTGPYSHRLHRLIRANAEPLQRLRDEAQRLARECARDGGHVLSHGEPSTANVLRHGGQMLLLDWTGLAWGPPERDWFHVRRTLGTVAVDCRAEFLRFYELRWILGEVSEYTARFVGHHTGDSDDEAMWHRLLRYVPQRSYG